eukprot:271646_1
MLSFRPVSNKIHGGTQYFSTLSKLVKPSITIDNTGLFIDNRFVDSFIGKRIDVIDPRNESIITSVSEGTAEDIDIAVDSAHNAFYKGPWYNKYTASERGRILNKWADLIEQNTYTLSTIESWDVGQPLSLARQFIGPNGLGVNAIRYYAGYADKANGDTLLPDGSNFVSSTYREPIGVIGAILPWNGPSILFMWHAAAVLSLGNTLVVKPAETSPLGTLFLAKLAAEAGIPDGVLNVVPGYGETAGQALCRNNKLGKISFTGEDITGKAVMKTASENLIPVSMELGGKSPLIVFPDANIDTAVGIAQRGTFTNSGQICCASTRIFLHESIYDEFVEKTVAVTNERKIGDNLGEEDVDQGPQQNKDQFEKVLGYLNKGKDEGADVLAGGNRLFDQGYFVESTVFGNVKDDMDIARNEIFGPCMQLLKFNDNTKNHEIDDVLQRANNTRYGLAAGVITNDTNLIHQCRKKLQAGTVWVNCWHAFFAQNPFGGYKGSGFGRIGGSFGIDNYTKVKVVTQMML